MHKKQTNNTRKHTQTNKQYTCTHKNKHCTQAHTQAIYTCKHTRTHQLTHTHVHSITSKCVLFETLTFGIHCNRLLDLPSQNYINYIL